MSAQLRVKQPCSCLFLFYFSLSKSYIIIYIILLLYCFFFNNYIWVYCKWSRTYQSLRGWFVMPWISTSLVLKLGVIRSTFLVFILIQLINPMLVFLFLILWSIQKTSTKFLFVVAFFWTLSNMMLDFCNRACPLYRWNEPSHVASLSYKSISPCYI